VSTCSACRREFETTFLGNGRPHKCCPDCRQEAKDRRTKIRTTDPEAVARYQRELRRKWREAALAAYGGTCTCCGESRYEFLAIDHIDGGGTKERRANFVNGSAVNKWLADRWLADRGYPPGYRVLCHNCNSALGYYDYCPHQIKITQK
jgi:hypothetical protein